MHRILSVMLAVFLLGAYSIMITGCGGGGSSGPAAPPPDDMMGGEPQMCPEGQVGTPPDCMAAGPSEEEVTKQAGTKEEAIKTEFDQTTDAGLGGTDVTTVMMEISRDRDSTTVKITDSAMAGDDDPKFAQAMDLGGGTTMHSRMMEADNDGNVVEEVVIVSTDIEAPKATKFADVYELNARKDGETATDSNPNNTLDLGVALDSGTPADATVLGRVKSSSFASDVAAVLTFTFDDDDTADMDEAAEVAGTYDGAMGTYRCNGDAACTVSLNAKGMITAMSDGWIFTPDADVTVDVPDADYLHYGVWLKKTTDNDGILTYNEVETFAGSSMARTTDAAIASGGSVTGKATYSGGATGVYVHAVANPDGTRASATSGHFTADAELTAHFGQTVDNPDTTPDESGQIPPSLLNSLSGTINNFMLSGHDTGPGWSVSLVKDSIDGSGPDPHVSGTAKGGGTDGSYSATFHGPVGDHDSDAETPAIPHPGSVVGEFNAFFSNGSVAGAFGATKDD